MPMLPPAPVRLSTTNDCLNTDARCSATARAVVSTPPPAVTFTTMRTGRCGYACANDDGTVAALSAIQNAARRTLHPRLLTNARSIVLVISDECVRGRRPPSLAQSRPASLHVHQLGMEVAFAEARNRHFFENTRTIERFIF